jgi:transcriptional regulator with XRE-family HTH domain
MDGEFGRWLRRVRFDRGWSLRTVERALRDEHSVRLSDTHLCQIEKGKRDPLTISPYILRGLILLYGLEATEVVDRLGLSSGVAKSFGD